MRNSVFIILVIFALLIGCNKNKYITVKHIKPINRNRLFDKKNDKRKKRTKYVKVKILRQSADIKPAKKKKVKSNKTIKSDSTNVEAPTLDEPTNEPDSTGIF